MTEETAKKRAETSAGMKWAEFLVTYPPDAPPVLVEGALDATASGSDGKGNTSYLFVPKKTLLSLFCATPACDGLRLFERNDYDKAGSIGNRLCFSITYLCRNCGFGRKLYVVLLRPLGKPPTGAAEAVKLGEWPPYDERVPNRAIRLIEPDKQLFFQGRKAENRGLGIGALAYYRRVLENQKARIIGEILKAAQRLGAKPEQLAELERARDAWRFTDAVDKIKAAIPDSLLVLGQNPLTLLHDAMSEGIHDLSDQECLSRANAIREVLTELALSVEEALKEQAELHGAVKVLMDARQKASSTESGETASGPTEPKPGS